MRKFILACLAVGGTTRSPFDSDCAAICKLVGGCSSSGSHCKSNNTCHGLFRYRSGLCLDVTGGHCPTTLPMPCEHARRLNPDLACADLVLGSYCKFNQITGSRVCQGIGTTQDGSPCRIGTRLIGCSEARPFSCDSAIMMRMQ